MITSDIPSEPQTQTQQPTNRRSRLETYCEIMRAIAGGAGIPTHIMYRANLSWTSMQGCIKVLERQGLVQTQDDKGKRSYQLTSKGFGLLRQYLSIKEELVLSPEANDALSYASVPLAAEAKISS